MPLLARQGPARACIPHPEHDEVEGWAKQAQLTNEDALGLFCDWGRVPPPDVELYGLQAVHPREDLMKFMSLR
jgi:hypothetical protein